MHHMVDLLLVNRMKLSNLKRQSACQNQYTDSPGSGVQRLLAAGEVVW